MKVNEGNFLQELQKGNQSALVYVIERYGGMVMTVVRKHLYLLADKQEECFDDVFLAVWHYIGSFDENRNEFKGWIAAIARNQAIDYLRKYKRQLEELSYEEEIAGRSEEVLILELEREISEETEKMLACLTERDQELMKRIYMNEDSVAVIAEETGMNENVIYKRVSRSKAKIRKLYREGC